MNEKRTIGILYYNIFWLFCIMMSIFPIAQVLSEEFGITAGLVGSIAGVSSLLMTLLAIPSGVLADRYGKKKMILIAIIVTILSLVVVTLSRDVLMFTIGWTLFGISRGLMITPSFAIVPDISSPKERGKVMGIVTSSIAIGSAAGYIISGFLCSSFGWSTTFAIFSAIQVLSLLVTLKLKNTGERNTSITIGKAFVNSFKWLKYKEVSISCIIATGYLFIGVYAVIMVPFIADAHDYSLVYVSLMFIPLEIVTGISAVVFGNISDKFGRIRALVIAQFLIIAALVLLYFLPFDIITFSIVFAFVGIARGPVLAIFNTVITDTVMQKNPKEIGAALGTFRTLQGVGVALGPILGGVFYEAFGYKLSFLLGAVLAVAMLLLTAVIRSANKAPVMRHFEKSDMGQKVDLNHGDR
ncbi:MFS transporter [Gorillibacterium sp. CAU 1737]|uniref:MFS transporter n=1 Tax=Gorillibacterium sp. CAU 1737 TaxID=3140362 RepID=UPI0032614AA8